MLPLLEFNKENILLGPNNSGKSLVIAAINLMKNCILTHQTSYKSDAYHIGDSFGDAVYLHDVSKEIKINLVMDGGGTSNEYALTTLTSSSLRVSADDRIDFHNLFSIHEPKPDKHMKGMNNIWYLAPVRRVFPSSTHVGDVTEAIDALANNITQFLLEKSSQMNEIWESTVDWLRKIDPLMSQFMAPITGKQVYAETRRKQRDVDIPIKLAFQGLGLQSAFVIIAAVLLSPRGSTLIVEEPENFLHPRTQEIIVDLFNHAVNDLDKQIIFTTHSFEMLEPYVSDIGVGSKRGNEHITAQDSYFKAILFKPSEQTVDVEELILKGRPFMDLKKEIKDLWG